MRVLKGLPPHFEMLKVVLNNQSSSLTKDQLLISLRSEEMRIGVAPRSDGAATLERVRKWAAAAGEIGTREESMEVVVAAAAQTRADGVRGKAKQDDVLTDLREEFRHSYSGSNGKAQVADEEEQDDEAEPGHPQCFAYLHHPNGGVVGPEAACGHGSDLGCMGSVMLHGHEKGGKLDARAVMCVCVGVDMESKGWRMLDPPIMRIRIARDVDFLENVMWKDWDKATSFGELLQGAAAISQLLPLPLTPPSAAVDDADTPPSTPPPAPLSVSVQQQPAPLQQLSDPSVIQRRSAPQASSSSSSSGQRPVTLSTSAHTAPATTSPPPVTGLHVLGIRSGTGGKEVGGDAGVVEGMLCLAKEVEGVPLVGVSTSDVPCTLAEALHGPEDPAWKTGAEKEVNTMRTMGVWDPEPQAPRAWNEEIGTTLIAAGFDSSASDEALYIRFVDEEPVYVLVYVDDLLLVSPRLEQIGQVKEVLAQR
ncbi:unnamed protein product [Closterium sp. Yama58-4]|nr:unnamed protein product [Closterium sp. Yama58-4]